MKSPIFTGILILFLMFSTTIMAQAESEKSTKTEQSITATGTAAHTSLLVDSITVVDNMHVTLKFNQDVIDESVRVRITKQSDESNVRIGSFSGMTDTGAISIVLSDTLESTTAYKLTIISAISDDGIIIKDGADGLKEFTTLKDLPKFFTGTTADIALNAPANPNAVMIDAKKDQKTGSGISNSGTSVQVDATKSIKELPLTGIDATVFAVIAGILGLILIKRRHQT